MDRARPRPIADRRSQIADRDGAATSRDVVVGTTTRGLIFAMSAITQASAQVAKTVAVSTGKVTNAKSMMVWKPHGNKYVIDM